MAVRTKTLRSYENMGVKEVLEEPISSFFQAVRTETAVNMDKARTGEKYRTYLHDIIAQKTVLTNVANHFMSGADTKVVEFPAV